MKDAHMYVYLFQEDKLFLLDCSTEHPNRVLEYTQNLQKLESLKPQVTFLSTKGLPMLQSAYPISLPTHRQIKNQEIAKKNRVSSFM